MQPSNYEINRQKYRWFAENRKRSEAEINADFDRLMTDDLLVGLDFMAHNPKILMLQTPIIDIAFEGEYRRIGSFVVFIYRWHQERSWKLSYRFINQHGTLTSDEDHWEVTVHHPHIIDEGCGEIGRNAGRLCVSEGSGLLETPLREGRIADGYPMLLQALTVYPTGTPYVPVDQWPVVGTYGAAQ